MVKKTRKEILEDLMEVIDHIEDEYGALEGLEILLSKDKTLDGEPLSMLKEVNLYYFTKTNILDEEGKLL